MLLELKPIRKDEDYPELYHDLVPFRTNQIVKKELYGIVGTTVNGQTVLFPDSYQRGFIYELTPLHERPLTNFEVPGLATTTSDGHMNYSPSFNLGRELAKELKFYVLAGHIKKLSQENEGLKGMIQDLKSKVEDIIKKQKS
jgi:hypothetical protein